MSSSHARAISERRTASGAGYTLMMIGVMLGILSLAMIVFIVWGILSARETTYPEGSLVFSVLELANGRPLYRDVTTQPHVYTPYGPLLYFAGAGAVRILGAAPDVAPLVLRCLPASFALLAAWMVARLARMAGATPWGSRIGAILFLAAPPTLGYSSTARPDLWALALGLAALAIGLAGSGRRTAAVCGLLLGLSLLAKPVALGALLTVTCVLWQSRRRIDLLLVHGLAAGLFGAAFTAQYLWAGEAYLQSFRIIVSVTPNLRTPPNLLLTFVRICMPAVVLAVLAVAQEPRSRLFQWWQLFPFAAAGVAWVTALRIGDLNHTLEFLAAVCVVSALGWDRLVMDGRFGSAKMMGALAMVVVLIPPTGEAASTILRTFDPLPRLDPELVRRLDPVSSPILSHSSDIPVLLRKKPALLDPLLFSYAERMRQWNPVPLLEALRSHRVGAVVLTAAADQPYPELQRFPVWPQGVLETVREAYGEVARGAGWVLYLPANATDVPSERRETR